MIHTSSGAAMSYEVFSMNGKQMLRGVSEGKELDLSALKSGVYFLRIGDKLQKIVKF